MAESAWVNYIREIIDDVTCGGPILPKMSETEHSKKVKVRVTATQEVQSLFALFKKTVRVAYLPSPSTKWR